MIRPEEVRYASAEPPEFVPRSVDLGGQGLPVAQAARDLGVSGLCLRTWMAVVEVDSGRREGVTSVERAELVELRRRNRVLEMADKEP